MALTWLHVSDFHFRPVDSYDRNVVLKALVAAVDRFRKQGRKPDLIFATGDIGHSGQAGDYQSAGGFFDALLLAAGVDKRRLFVVPGNHDVDRSKGRALCRTLTSANEADDYFVPGEVKLHISQKLRAFADWYNAYFKGIRSFAEDTTCGPVELVTIRSFRIAILPLNSALFCDDDHDHAKLWLGHRCLKAAVDNLKDRHANLNLGLIHHPLDWLAGGEAGRIKTALSETLDVLLRGHLHENEAGLWAPVTGTTLQLAAGAAYQTREYPNRALYVTVDKGEAAIFPIHYVDNPREAWVLDTSCFPLTDDYQGRFPIPRLAKTNPHDSLVTPPAVMTERVENRKANNELRFLILKARLTDALTVSGPARAAIQRQMPPRDGLINGSDRERAAEMVEILIEQKFDAGKNILLTAHQELVRTADKTAIAALVTVSRLLIPWLYIASINTADLPLDSEFTGDVISLPAGIETFAEIVMAGIDRRDVAFQAVSNDEWPRGTFGLSLTTPESGISGTQEQDIRDDLFARLRPPPQFKTKPADFKDQVIAKRLEYFLKKKGVRVYIVCILVPRDHLESQSYENLLMRIAKRYPALTIVKLNDLLELDHQELFDEIRDLLLPNREPT